MKQAYIYIITNKRNGTLYTGVTSDLVKRIYEHKHKLTQGFSAKYGLDMLVYYEIFDNIESAIEREKYLKGKRREFKIKLINDFNPAWEDLYDKIL
ncbi:excinuclease ABC subunit C [Helicobacter didelphidarum]|uniref:Excinuclease ABC subunit C n=1 Tax=Helicobacter didelphidarum TaxID=2040648 RepID=A0A3D8IHL0_9HELI|nr:GIY-YIG nuclease family protein [Helicobacter didelphidarum]RDU64613.1 excinuclease ABC subunit C [Helicobacter didelphidarum]